MPKRKKGATAKGARGRKRRGAAKRGRSIKPGLWVSLSDDVRMEVQALLWLLFTALTFLSLWGALGALGDLWSFGLRTAFGTAAWLVPVASLYIGCVYLVEQDLAKVRWRNFMAGVLLFLLAALFHTGLAPVGDLFLVPTGEGGGYVGLVLTRPLFALIGQAGTAVVYAALSIVVLLLALNVSLRRLFMGRPATDQGVVVQPEVPIAPSFASKNIAQLRSSGAFAKLPKPLKTFQQRLTQEKLLPEAEDREKKGKKAAASAVVPVKDGDAASSATGSGVAAGPAGNTNLSGPTKSGWQAPSLALLSDTSFVVEVDEKQIQKQATIIGQTLADFGIAVEMRSVNVGPTVVQYTLKPSTGIKLSKIVALQNDLALALAAESIRIEAPIPGQALVGIEIPAKKRADVGLKGVLESAEFQSAKGRLNFAVGRDVSGKPIVGSLDQMPHLLIAGATGSGKSVCINTLLLSLLCNHTPESLRLIMIDPKRVELNVYNHIPHLLSPVIVNAKRTVSALRWAVAEMNRRYRILADGRCKNISEYNKAHKAESLHYIVIVIDELADLMMLASKEVEALVCRLAQMARAVGIHMVLATQRPSVDVITGLIKANMPVRFAFTVVSQTDSRTIIDQAGAEKLLGRGDMLYISSELPKPKRVQGVFVSTEEVKRIVSDLKLNARPEYNEEITDKRQPVPEGIPANKVVLKEMIGDGDLEQEAIKVIQQTKKASASLLQRYLKVGYARAARILDELEQKGVVGPAQGSKPRRILVDLAGVGAAGAAGALDVEAMGLPVDRAAMAQVSAEDHLDMDDDADYEAEDDADDTDDESDEADRDDDTDGDGDNDLVLPTAGFGKDEEEDLLTAVQAKQDDLSNIPDTDEEETI